MSSAREQVIDLLWDRCDPFKAMKAMPKSVDHQGWNSDHRYLARAIDDVRPRVVIEVGVWKGGSVLTMAARMREKGVDGVVIAIDTWLGSSEHFLAKGDVHGKDLNYLNGYPRLYNTFIANVFDQGLEHYVVPLPLDSVNAFQVINSLGIRPDVLHVDAGHDFQSATNDLTTWWPFLAPGGVLIGDDYFSDGSVWPEVKRAFDAFFGSNKADVFESESAKCYIRKPF